MYTLETQQDYIKKSQLIWIVLGIGLVVRLFTLSNYGLSLTLNSDDMGYTNSAINLLKSGMLTYHNANEPTVHIMPGMPALLAVFFMIFGSGTVGLYAAKIGMTLIGLGSIYGVYLIGKRVWNLEIGLLASACLALSIPQIVTDNLLLTESPATMTLIFLMYYSIRLAKEQTMKMFYLVMVFFVLSLMFRPTIALFPLLLFVYLLVKKYPYKLMVKQAMVSIVIMLVVLGPWWVRNYVHFGDFIPLSGGSGNPLLLGTYQGYGYPNDETLDETLARIEKEHTIHNWYERLNYQKIEADHRLDVWWETDKMSLIKSFTIEKTKLLWSFPFYWIPIFDINMNSLVIFHHASFYFAFIGMIGCFIFFRKTKYEMLFILGLLVYFTALFNLYYSFNRYNQTLMPFVFLLESIGVYTIFKLLYLSVKKVRVSHLLSRLPKQEKSNRSS